MFRHDSGSAIAVDGADIYFETAGDPRQPPLLLLHGGLGSIEDFNPLLATDLVGHFHLIGIDSRGHGRSTLGPTPLTYERLELDVVRVLQHLGISQTAVLGFSDGGVVGYRLAIGGRIGIDALATIGAGHELRPDDPVRTILRGVTAESWLRRFPGADALVKRLNPAASFETLVSRVVEMWLSSDATGYPSDAVSQIHSDLLIIRGDADHLFPLDVASRLVSLVAGARFANIPFAGHATHADQPDIVARILSQFFGAR